MKQQDGGVRNPCSETDHDKAICLMETQSGTISSLSSKEVSNPSAVSLISHCAGHSDTAGAHVSERKRRKVNAMHVDIIGDQFWTEHPEVVGSDCS